MTQAHAKIACISSFSFLSLMPKAYFDACDFIYSFFNTFPVRSQLLFFLIAAVLLAREGYGKPYVAEQLFVKKDLNLTAANLALIEDMNETSVLRNKRGASYLKHYCSKKTPSRRSKQHCEAWSYVCYGYYEIVCSKTSLACLESVPRAGLPKCVPQYRWVTIDLGSQGKRRVRRTYACSCAQIF